MAIPKTRPGGPEEKFLYAVESGLGDLTGRATQLDQVERALALIRYRKPIPLADTAAVTSVMVAVSALLIVLAVDADGLRVVALQLGIVLLLMVLVAGLINAIGQYSKGRTISAIEEIYRRRLGADPAVTIEQS